MEIQSNKLCLHHLTKEAQIPESTLKTKWRDVVLRLLSPIIYQTAIKFGIWYELKEKISEAKLLQPDFYVMPIYATHQP